MNTNCPSKGREVTQPLTLGRILNRAPTPASVL